MISAIPTSAMLSKDDSAMLTAPFTTADLQDVVAHAPTGKSPGLDGLPFEIYSLLLRHPLATKLLLQVMNDALHSAFPDSWLRTRLILLFKKGDASDLANWRPLSLINSDAKIFTKLLANRLRTCITKLINPFQTGFLPGRLIADNGWTLQALMAHARATDSAGTNVGVLLDQEKAYDRIHRIYLERVLTAFGFPSTLTDSLTTLFFNTQIHISINGFLSSAITQRRGLRQGDPISPLLFNLAFEPLLRRLLSDNAICGMAIHPPLNPLKGYNFGSNAVFPESLPIKLMAYADDLLVFLSQPAEWPCLLDQLETYNQASNAKVNLAKTVIFPLAGRTSLTWPQITSGFGGQWHDNRAPAPLVYLGYPVWHNTYQKDHFLDMLMLKIAKHAQLLQARKISILGRSFLANSLLLSRLWHVLRVVNPNPKWLKQVESVVRRYVCPFGYKPSWNQICKPRSSGGAAVVHVTHQSRSLPLTLLQACLQDSPNRFVCTVLRSLFRAHTGHASLLMLLLLPKLMTGLLRRIPPLQALARTLA
jgi:hypothetical protein